MATNGILDITTEEYMGRDPEMEILPGSDDMLEIKKTLEIVGVPQEQYGEFTERFMEWRKRNNGTFDMFLEEIYQLPPGTITKIKTEQQVARGPEDLMQTEEEMTIQPGSPDMQEIMQSVGASQKVAQGGRIGYQMGEQVLPMPRPTDEDPRAAFFRRMGALPEQTLLGQPQYLKGNMMGQRTPQGIMGATQDPFGGLLGGDVSGIDDAGLPGQPLVEYEHEGAEQPPSWWERMRTGTHDGSLDHSLDMNIIIDFLKKMGMAITQENIAKAAQALGMAMKFGPMGASTSLGIEGLRSLGAPEEIEETETETIGFRDGGITNAVPRQGFFLGKVAKAITGGAKKVLKSAKKVLKSDLGKAAMLYLATAGIGNVAAQQGLGGAQRWGGFKWLQPGNVGRNIGSAVSRVIPASWKNVKEVTDVADGKGIIDWNALKMETPKWLGETGLAEVGTTASTLGTKELTKAATPWYKGALPWIGATSLLGGAYTAANPGDVQFDTGKRDEEVNKWTEWLAQIPPADDIVYPYPNYTGVAQGGRVGAQEGGIMNLGGMEKDYRNTGGFVDIGAKEKADDVPARLSVNEFVMTADAVRGAGDGDVEEGAERLQDTMKQLEQKGKRHKAAQGMFATSQRLGEVI